jgi:hypothetical protein
MTVSVLLYLAFKQLRKINGLCGFVLSFAICLKKQQAVSDCGIRFCSALTGIGGALSLRLIV